MLALKNFTWIGKPLANKCWEPQLGTQLRPGLLPEFSPKFTNITGIVEHPFNRPRFVVEVDDRVKLIAADTSFLQTVISTE